MKLFSSLLFLIYLTQTNAQNLTGIWRGTFTSNNGQTINGYEVQIDNIGNMAKGVTYSYGGGANNFYLKFSLVGIYDSSEQKILFQEDVLLDHKRTSFYGVENFTCYLAFLKVDKKEILEGDYKSQNYNSKKPGSYGGKVHLEKVADSYFYKEDFIIKREAELANQQKEADRPIPKTIITKSPSTKNKPAIVFKQSQINKNKLPKKANLAPTKPDVAPVADIHKKQPIVPVFLKSEAPKKLAAPVELPKVLRERTNELFKTIPVSANEIEVNFYDNGEIDGDTISVYLNGRLLASHRGLTIEPITFKIKIDADNPDQEIIMVAENLGTIPPNTALMIVKVGGKRYDVSLSSNEQKNAMVRFRFQKE